VSSLKVEPELGGGIECLREKPGRLGGDTSLAPHEFVDSLYGHAEVLRKRNLGLTQGQEELLPENLARVRGNPVLRLHGYPLW
jgi:hypothetical protein